MGNGVRSRAMGFFTLGFQQNAHSTARGVLGVYLGRGRRSHWRGVAFHGATCHGPHSQSPAIELGMPFLAVVSPTLLESTDESTKQIVSVVTLRSMNLERDVKGDDGE